MSSDKNRIILFHCIQFQNHHTSIVWAYGKAKSFSKVKSEIHSRWMSKNVLLYGSNGKIIQTTLTRTTNRKLTKGSTKSPASSKSENGKSDQLKNQDFINAETEKKLKLSTKDEKTVSGGDEDLSPEAMEDSRKAEKMLSQRQMRKKTKSLSGFFCNHILMKIEGNDD